MGKFINELSGANRLHRGMEKILEEGHELPEGVTLEGAKGIMDTWGWTEESMKMAFENGIMTTLCTIGGIAVGHACVKVIGLIKERIKTKKKEAELERLNEVKKEVEEQMAGPDPFFDEMQGLCQKAKKLTASKSEEEA